MLLPLLPALIIKLAFWCLAFAVFARLGARVLGGPDDALKQTLLAGILGAIAGSKLLYAMTYPVLLAEAPAQAVLFLVSGDSVAGAIIGGRLGLLWGGPRDTAGRLADDLLPAVAGALAFLHAGAVFWALRGGDYGVPTGLPWGLDFGDGIERHPVMIYELAVLAGAFAAQRALTELPLAAGVRASMFMLAYLAGLAVVGYLKPPFDAPALPEALLPQPTAYMGLVTAEQAACMVAVLLLVPAWAGALRAALRDGEEPAQ